jgi:dTMP kinase
MARGRFITFEGPEGAGKSTQLALAAEWLRQRGTEPVVTREPGGTPVGDRIREVMFRPDVADGEPASTDHSIRPLAEALLMSAARAQHVQELLLPALEAGKLVLCDRYADATLAYQGYGRGGDLAELRTIIAIATRGLQPDHTILLDLPIDASLDRLTTRGADNFFDSMGPEFRQRVRDGFLALAAAEPQRWVVVDGTQSVETVAERIWEGVDTPRHDMGYTFRS